MKIPIQIQREIARMIDLGLSNRKIADYLDISSTTVSKFRKLMHVSGKNYLDIAKLDDESFSSAVGTKSKVCTSTKFLIDWPHIQDELRHANMTLLLLWQEYLHCNKDTPENCLSYSQFNRRFKAWLKTQRISMRQIHSPGEKLFVDFCGRVMTVINPDTGEPQKAYVFVGVLGASSYIFAYAVSTQSSADWIECHIRAFHFLGGVPKQVVSDNLKAAVIKHTKYSVEINQAYGDCAEHYQFLINPTRTRKPKDKSLAEVGVKIVQQCILARLRHRKFFSIEELNQEIAKGIEQINLQKRKAYNNKSRYQRFIELDKPALHPLPESEHERASWVYNIKIPDDYHVEHGGSFYSVPYQYRFHRVDLKITQTMLTVMLNRQCIACHPLLSTPGISRLPEHMPESHRFQEQQEPTALLEWAARIGPSVLLWVQMIFEKRRDFANGLKAVRKLRSWAKETQNYAQLEAACEFALHYNIFSFQRLKNIVISRLFLHSQPEFSVGGQQHCNLRGSEYFKSGDLNNAN